MMAGQDAPQGQSLEDVYNSAGKAWGVAPSLLYAIGSVESGNSTAPVTSSAGAQGIQQVMPATGQALGATNLQDPTQSIYASAKLMSQLLKQYGGDGQKALMAYNAGQDQSKWNPGYATKVATAQQKLLQANSKGTQAMPTASDSLLPQLSGLPEDQAPAPTQATTPAVAAATPAASLLPTLGGLPEEGIEGPQGRFGAPNPQQTNTPAGYAASEAGLKLAGVDMAGPALQALAYGHDKLMGLMGLMPENWGPNVAQRFGNTIAFTPLSGLQTALNAAPQLLQQAKAIQAANLPIAAQSPEGEVVRLAANIAPAALGGAGLESLVGAAGRGLGAAGEAAATRWPAISNVATKLGTAARGLGETFGGNAAEAAAKAGREAPSLGAQAANIAARGATQGVGAQLATAGTNTPTPGSLAEAAAGGAASNIAGHAAVNGFKVLASPLLAGLFKMHQTDASAGANAAEKFMDMVHGAGKSLGDVVDEISSLGPHASAIDSSIPAVQEMAKRIIGGEGDAAQTLHTVLNGQTGRLSQLRAEAPEIIKDVTGASDNAHGDISALEQQHTAQATPLYTAAANTRVPTPESVKAMLNLPHAPDSALIEGLLQEHLNREFGLQQAAGQAVKQNDFQLYPHEVDAQGNRLFNDQGENIEAQGLRATAQQQRILTPQTIKDLAASPYANQLEKLQTHLDNIREVNEAAGGKVNPEDYKVYVGGRAAPQWMQAIGGAGEIPAQLNSKLPMAALIRLRDSLPEPSSTKYDPLADVKKSLTADLHAASPQLAKAEQLEAIPEKRELAATLPMQALMDLKNSLKLVANRAAGGPETLGNSSLARTLGVVEQHRFPDVSGLRNQLSDELHAASPAYAQADKLMSDLKTAKEAYAEGQNFSDRNPQQIKDYLNGTNQLANNDALRQQWHKAGVVQSLVDKVTGPYTSQTALGRTVAQITTDPTVKAALGEAATAKLLPRLQALETKARNATNLLRYAGRGGAAAPQAVGPEVAKGAAASLAMGTHIPFTNAITRVLTNRADYMTPNEERAMSRLLALPDAQDLPKVLGALLPPGKYKSVGGDLVPKTNILRAAGNVLQQRGFTAVPQALGVAANRQGPVNPLSPLFGSPQQGTNQ